MNKFGLDSLDCLTAGELTEYHDDAPHMPRARRAEIAGHLSECGDCASGYVEAAELDAFTHWALTVLGEAVRGEGQLNRSPWVSGKFVRDLRRMAEETVKS